MSRKLATGLPPTNRSPRFTNSRGTVVAIAAYVVVAGVDIADNEEETEGEDDDNNNACMHLSNWIAGDPPSIRIMRTVVSPNQ